MLTDVSKLLEKTIKQEHLVKEATKIIQPIQKQDDSDDEADDKNANVQKV